MLLILAVFAALSSPAIPPVHPDAGAPSRFGMTPMSERGSAPALRDSLDVYLYARVLKSADQRVLDSALMVTALESRDPEIRRVAARTISQVALRHRRRAIPMLEDLTHDSDTAVASSAIFGLGLVRDTAAIPLLARIYRSMNESSAAAAWSLGEIGAPAVDTVVALLRQTGAMRPQAAIRELLIAASKHRPVNVAAVEPYLRSSDSELRWAAAYAIARNRAPSGARALLHAAHPDAAFRAELARELTLPTVGDSLRAGALQRLRALVTDSSPYVRINALQSISTFGTVSRAVILSGLRDRDANVRVAAAQSSAPAFDSMMSVWLDAWNADTSYKVHMSLLQAAASNRVQLPGEAEWRTSPDWRRRAAALRAVRVSHDSALARTDAMVATRDGDSRVRGIAYNMLAASDSARRDTAVQRVLLAARSDPDSIVRNSLPGSRVRPVDTAAVERPIEWYVDAVRRVVVPSLRGHPLKAELRTVRGPIVITLSGVLAPLTVLNYATLVQAHAYDNLRFHRVVPAFVAQDGDPRGDGEGGPGYSIRDELTLLPCVRGAVGMALSGPDTGGSQYFLTLTPQPHLTGHYTVFGNVTSGLGAMDALVEGDSISSVSVRW